MKKGIILLLLVSSVSVKAQTLKEALYSGKLKADAGTVIRKGDDLSTKMDTARNTTNDTLKTTATLPGVDSTTQSLPLQTDTALPTTTDTANVAGNATNKTAIPAAAPTNNNTIWKAYMDTVVSTLKTEVLSSKKIKRGGYAILVTYTIDTDGQTTISDVFLSPENSYLQQQIKIRLDADTPRLNPVLNSVGAPRKVIKKHSFTVSKE